MRTKLRSAEIEPMVDRERLKQAIEPPFATEWITSGDHSIICYRLYTTGRNCIDQFRSAVIELLNTWPADKPLYMLLDLSFPNASVNMYVLTQFRELMQHRAEISSKVALVTNSRYGAEIMTYAVRSVPRGARDWVIFDKEDSALTWLQG